MKFLVFHVDMQNIIFFLYFIVPCLTDTEQRYNHEGMEFSTKDVDNDLSLISCASFALSGWWFNDCLGSNLNGRYRGPSATDDVESNSCKGFSGVDYRSLKTVMMMVRGVE